MDFAVTPEQQQILDSVDRFARLRLPPGEVRVLRPDEVQLLGIGAGQAPADALQPTASQSETAENDG